MFVHLCDVDGTGWATNPKPQAALMAFTRLFNPPKKLFPRAVLTNARPVSVYLTLRKGDSCCRQHAAFYFILTKDVDFGSFVMFLRHTVRVAAHRNI